MGKSTDSQIFYDGLFDFSMGLDSYSQPLLLQRNQAAFITNGTVRGTFVSPRPPYNKITLNYSTPQIQSAFEGGLWQGGCFYNPDFGNQCLMASASGRLFQFSISGNTCAVTEKTIPGDPDSSSATQCWLWQSEQFIIWNDGQNLPVFYDGSTSRRSMGAETLLATIVNNFDAPAIYNASQQNLAAATVPVTLSSPYTGPYNATVGIVSGGGAVTALYQTLGNPQGYPSVLTNLSDAAGSQIAIGEQVTSDPSVFGVLAVDSTITVISPTTIITLNLTAPPTVPVGANFILGGILFFYKSLSGNVATVYPLATFTPQTTFPAGTIVYLSSNTQPNVPVGTVVSPFTVPTIGSTVNVFLSNQYSGIPGATVFINNGQYTITAGAGQGPVPSNILALVNINDVPGTAYAAPPYSIVSLAELPAGRMGAYGMGRNWESLTNGRSYIASDIVGGTSGTPAYQSRDAVLRIFENTYLAGGGVFQIPGSAGDIRAMVFGSTIDSSLGQGPLQVYTPNIAFSCNAPVDRTTWSAITNPILTQSLISNGALSQNATIQANGDTMFRAVDGIRSLILGQRQFSTWGNVPLSIEMSRVIDADNTSLLNYSSSVVFDNRLLMTAAPVAGPQGVYHQATMALNFDPISSIDEKIQPLFDGMWTGLNVLQYVKGLVNGVERCFAFTYNTSLQKLELYEILSDQPAIAPNVFDNGVTPITWGFESASLFSNIKGKGPFDLVRLQDGEIYIDNLVGQAHFQVFYKPDQYPNWTLWYEWDVCAKMNNPGSPVSDPMLQPQFRTRMGLGMPSAGDCDPNTGFPLREGSTFQMKFVITGYCRFLGAKFMAISMPDIFFAKPLCDAICPP